MSPGVRWMGEQREREREEGWPSLFLTTCTRLSSGSLPDVKYLPDGPIKQLTDQ